MNPPSGLALGKTAPGSSAETEAAEVFTVSLGLIGGAGFALLFTLLGTMVSSSSAHQRCQAPVLPSLPLTADT